MYGLKSSGAAWHAQLSTTLSDMNFTPSKADPDVCMRAACKPNGYEYILVYVDDLLVVSHAPELIMETIRKAYRLIEEPAPPTTYLGATVLTCNVVLPVLIGNGTGLSCADARTVLVVQSEFFLEYHVIFLRYPFCNPLFI
jgi:hypothetical protein